MLHTARAQEAPAVIRYPRGRGTGVAIPPNPLALPIGKAEVLEEMKPAVPAADSGQIGCGTGAPEVALWGLGDFIPLARETGAVLAAKGMVSVLVDARFVRPLDTELLRTQIEGGVRLVATFENAMASGGFGSAVEEAVSDLGLAAEVLRIGWPDEYLTHADTVAELLRKHGLEPTPLADRIAERLAARHEA
jgi:1-deoxy-D-xylulose-5-phosphate synthase